MGKVKKGYINMVCEGSVRQKSDQIPNSFFKAGVLCFWRRCSRWHEMDLNMKAKNSLTTYVLLSTHAFLTGVGFLQCKNGATTLALDWTPAEEERSHRLLDSVFVSFSSFTRDPLGSASLRFNRRLRNPALDSVHAACVLNRSGT